MSSEDTGRSAWWLYLVRTSSNALYCGITTDVERRFKQHQSGKGAKALRGRGPLELSGYYRVGYSKGEALKLELAVKKLSKQDKEQLLHDSARFIQLKKRVC